MKKILKNILKNIRSREITVVRKTVLPVAMATLTFAVSMTGCVKDELFNTPHPEKGAVVVTTDWTDALAEATVPDTYFLSMDGGETKEVQAVTNCYPDLLLPGKHTLLVYN